MNTSMIWWFYSIGSLIPTLEPMRTQLLSYSWHFIALGHVLWEITSIMVKNHAVPSDKLIFMILWSPPKKEVAAMVIVSRVSSSLAFQSKADWSTVLLWLRRDLNSWLQGRHISERKKIYCALVPPSVSNRSYYQLWMPEAPININ